MASITQAVIADALRGGGIAERIISSELLAARRRREEKAGFLANPDSLDKAVAAMAESFSPVVKRVSRPTRYVSKVEAADAAIPSGHPLKGFPQGLRDRFRMALQNPEYDRLSAGEILMGTAEGMLLEPTETGLSRLEASYKHKRIADAAYFGIGGEEETLTKLPGYEMWLESVQQAEDKDLASEEWFADWQDYKAAALWGGAIGAGFGAITGGPAGAMPMAATFAAVSPLYEAVAHPLRRAVIGTEWYRSKVHSGSKYEEYKAKAGELGLEFGLAFATGAGANKAFKKALTKAVETGRLADETATQFFRGRTARDAIAFGKARRDIKVGLEDVLRAANRGSVYDVAKEAVERAVAPPGLMVARTGLYKTTGLPALTREGERIARIRKGILDIEQMAQEIGTGATEMATGLKIFKAQRAKTVKQMFKELSDEGAESALRKSELTGDLDGSIRRTHAGETVLKSVAKDEAADYKAILVGKKRAGKKIHLTDKARVVLERSGYTANQIADMSSSKVVRLARKVRAERKGESKLQQLITTKVDEIDSAIIAHETRLQALRERFEAIGRKTEVKTKARRRGEKKRIAETVEEEVQEEAAKMISSAERVAYMRGVIESGKIAAARMARKVTIKRPPPERGTLPEAVSPTLTPEETTIRAGEVVVKAERVIPEELAVTDAMFNELERKVFKKYSEGAYKYWWESKWGSVEGMAKPDDKTLKAIDNLYKVLRRRYKVDISALPAAMKELAEEGITGIEMGRGAKYFEKEVLDLRSMFDAKNLGKFLMLGAASIPVINLLSPREAEASTAMLGQTISKTVAGLMKGTKRKMLDLMIDADKQALTAHTVTTKQKTLPRPQQQLQVNLDAWESLGSLTKSIARKKGFALGIDRFLTPYGVGSVLFKVGYNPAVQLASAQTAWGNNSRNALMVVRNILKDVPGNRNVAARVQREMEPLLDGYDRLVAHQTIDMKMEKIAGDIDLLYDDIAKTRGKKTLVNLESKLENAEARMEVLREARNKLQPDVNEFLTRYENTVRRLAEEHPSVRIALAVEDTADYRFRPWLGGMLNYEERTAVGYLKSLHEDYATRMLGQDLSVITERPFLHHALHPKFAERNAAEIVERLGVDVQTTIPFTHFRHRVQYSRAMMPEINYAMDRYIPDAERRLQMNRFWYGGGRKSWHSFKESSVVKANPVLRDYFDRLSRAYTPAETRGWNHWMNRYAAMETFLLLGFAPATAFKHFFKNIGTWGALGMRHSVSHMDEAFTTSVRNYINSPEIQRGAIVGGLKKIGLPHKMRKKVLDDFASSYTHQFRMMNMIADLEYRPPVGAGWWAKFDSGLQRLNQRSSVFIRGVESFDRAHSFVASLNMAAKKGMTAKQATYGIFDTILKNNFLGMGLNPKWMHNPTIRAIFLFQNTPFKLLERRLVVAYKAGKDLKAAFGVVRHQDIRKTLSQMRTLARDIKQGEDLLKQNLIADAITQHRDIFGTPLTKQFMREFIYAGAIIWGLGGIMDVDFMHHTFHLPFLRSGHFAGPKDPSMAISPFAAAAYRTIHGRQEALDRAEQPEFWVTEFMRNWLGKKGATPQTVHKLLRMSDDDIPDIYRDSDLMYLFSVPAAGEY